MHSLQNQCSSDLELQESLCQRILYHSNRPELFSTSSGIRITKVTPGRAEGELTISETSLNPHGYVHGGCLTTLADTVAGTAVSSWGRPCVTVNCSMDFFAPAKGKKIFCSAVPQKVGKTICVYQCVLTNDGGEHIGNGNFTFFLLDGGIPDAPKQKSGA